MAAVGIAADSIGKRRVKIVGVDFVASSAGGCNVWRTNELREVIVVEDKRAFDRKTGVKEDFFASWSFEHIAANAQVRVGELFSPKSRFASGRNADEKK